MSRSPLGEEPEAGSQYIDAFAELADRIHQGASFSGRERNCAFLNLQGDSFADASAALGLDLEQDSRGLAVSDWDHDGDVDLWLTNRTAPRLQFLRNENAASGTSSVAFLLVGDITKRCPMDAAGARAVVTAAGSDRVKTVHLGDGFLSQSSRWLHFGLGEAATVDRVVVHWPAGEAEEFVGANINGRFVLKQGTGKAIAAAGKSPKVPEAKKIKLPAPTEVSRVWFLDPAALPADLEIPNLPAGPAILNLWASWCAPCLAELEDFGGDDSLPLVPLNIENRDGSETISAKKAQTILASAGVEQAGGFASGELIDALNQIVSDKI